MPKRPRRSTISPFLHAGHCTPVLPRASSAGSCFTNLHLGKLEQAMKRPKRPSRSICLPSLHCGQASPISLGGAISLPSSRRAPRQLGNFLHDMKRPFLDNLYSIGPPHRGQGNSSGASPIPVILAIFSLPFIAWPNDKR